MVAFILHLVNILPAPLRAIARPVADRLIRVWQWSESLFRRVRSAFGLAVKAAQRLRDGITHLGREIYETLRWLATIRVPALIKSARDGILRWVTDRINEVRRLISATVETLRRWTVSAVNTLRSLVDNVRQWAAGILARIDAGLRRLLDRVFGLWSTPARLAAWLVGAMWSALWGYAWTNLDRLADAIWARRRALFLRTVAEAERIIGRLL